MAVQAATANGHGLTNRIMIDRAITVIGVDGPSNTIVVGRGNVGPYGIRCAYLTNGAFLAGFTLTNGHTFASGNEFFERSGGGAFLDNGGVISNCIITGCEADYHGGGIMVCTNGRIINSSINGNYCDENGGGIMLMTNGSVDRCYIYNNRSASDGGGIHFFNSGIVQNTLVTSNRATSGAGVYSYSDGSLPTAPRLYNCTIVHNAASYFCFDMIDIQGTNTVFSWHSASNRTYSISTTLDLSEGIWQNIITNITATPPLNVYTTKNSTILLRSYRLEVQQ